MPAEAGLRSSSGEPIGQAMRTNPWLIVGSVGVVASAAALIAFGDPWASHWLLISAPFLGIVLTVALAVLGEPWDYDWFWIAAPCVGIVLSAALIWFALPLYRRKHEPQGWLGLLLILTGISAIVLSSGWLALLAWIVTHPEIGN